MLIPVYDYTAVKVDNIKLVILVIQEKVICLPMFLAGYFKVKAAICKDFIKHAGEIVSVKVTLFKFFHTLVLLNT
jgi:hypothetical protein